MHHPTDRITHTTAFVTPVVEHWLERCFIGNKNHLELLVLYISERVAHVAAAGFLSHYLSGHLPYVRRHITINKMC